MVRKAYQAMITSTRFHLSGVQRMDGMGYIGSAPRIRRFIAKLLTGEGVRVGVVGGSISLGNGAGGPEKAYLTHFFRYIKKHFPSANHIMYNGAVPGTSSPYMSTCLDRHMPSDVDLVFVEYSFNDAMYPSKTFMAPQRRAYERLLRKLLDMPNKPAVVLVHMYAPCNTKPFNRFWTNAERDYSELARYYGLSEISVKAGLYHGMMEGNKQLGRVVDGLAGGESTTRTNKPERLEGGKERANGLGREVLHDALKDAALAKRLGLDLPFMSQARFFAGRGHPNAEGQMLVAELIISLFLRVVSDMVQAEVDGPESALSEAGKAAASLNLTMQAAGSTGRYRSLHGEPLSYMLQEAVKELPSPMSPNNYAWPYSVCVTGSAFHEAVIDNKGFKWLNESNKLGMVADEPGSWLDVLIPTQSPHANKNLQVLVQVVMLQSYEHMGTALVTCESGCTCQPSTFNGWTHETVSLEVMHDIGVSQSPKCRLRVTVKAETKSPDGGHKVKVVGVVTSEEIGSASAVSYGKLRMTPRD